MTNHAKDTRNGTGFYDYFYTGILEAGGVSLGHKRLYQNNFQFAGRTCIDLDELDIFKSSHKHIANSIEKKDTKHDLYSTCLKI